jgi:hypothetical protein
MIDNPAYKGEWAPRKIPNPVFFEDLTPVRSLPKIVGDLPFHTVRPLTLHGRVVSALSSGP